MITIEVTCQDPSCHLKEWEFPNMLLARKEARTHLKHTKHTVVITKTTLEFFEPEIEDY